MEQKEFSFGNDSVARAYDNDLVPILFDPWASRLVEQHGPWDKLHVLDLATGTGIVARKLGDAVGASGRVFGADINGQMLELARKRCADAGTDVEFIECPADSLGVPDESVDAVVCQQGFQFFPDKLSAALEIARVLRTGGKIVATTWLPVTQCEFFGAICAALTEIGEKEICEIMRLPFDFLSGRQLAEYFEGAGFADIRLTKETDNLVLDGGFAQAVKIAYSTPIGPKLRALPEEKQSEFRAAFGRLLQELSADGITMGCMVSNLVTARKPN